MNTRGAMPPWVHGGTQRDFFPLGSRDFPSLDRGVKKRRGEEIFSTRFEEIERIDNAGRFLVMKNASQDTDSITPISPFAVARSLRELGDVKDITRQKDGTLIIESKSKNQTARLLKVTRVGKHDVTVTEHPKLNRSKGIVKCWDFVYMEEKELLEELKSQKVVEVRHLRRKATELEKRASQNQKDVPVWKNTGTFVITFDIPDIPSVLKAGYLKLEVRPFVPDPIRCFSCQRFGHMKTSCRGVAMCGRCAEKDHYPDPCVKDVKCINCGGSHVSWHKRCPEYLAEYAVQKIKVYEKVSFAEAKNIFIERMGQSRKTFADTLRQQETPTQNGCTNCNCDSCKSMRNERAHQNESERVMENESVTRQNLSQNEEQQGPLIVEVEVHHEKAQNAESSLETPDISTNSETEEADSEDMEPFEEAEAELEEEDVTMEHFPKSSEEVSTAQSKTVATGPVSQKLSTHSKGSRCPKRTKERSLSSEGSEGKKTGLPSSGKNKKKKKKTTPYPSQVGSQLQARNPREHNAAGTQKDNNLSPRTIKNIVGVD